MWYKIIKNTQNAGSSRIFLIRTWKSSKKYVAHFADKNSKKYYKYSIFNLILKLSYKKVSIRQIELSM